MRTPLVRVLITSLVVALGSTGLASLSQSKELTIHVVDAAAHVGEQVTVDGIVANVHTSRAGNTFLNFGKRYPNQIFTAVIFKRDADKFGDPSKWEGKRVFVSGAVTLYKGKPEIILAAPGQIRLSD